MRDTPVSCMQNRENTACQCWQWVGALPGQSCLAEAANSNQSSTHPHIIFVHLWDACCACGCPKGWLISVTDTNISLRMCPLHAGFQDPCHGSCAEAFRLQHFKSKRVKIHSSLEKKDNYYCIHLHYSTTTTFCSIKINCCNLCLDQ